MPISLFTKIAGGEGKSCQASRCRGKRQRPAASGTVAALPVRSFGCGAAGPPRGHRSSIQGARGTAGMTGWAAGVQASLRLRSDTARAFGDAAEATDAVKERIDLGAQGPVNQGPEKARDLRVPDLPRPHRYKEGGGPGSQGTEPRARAKGGTAGIFKGVLRVISLPGAANPLRWIHRFCRNNRKPRIRSGKQPSLNQTLIPSAMACRTARPSSRSLRTENGREAAKGEHGRELCASATKIDAGLTPVRQTSGPQTTGQPPAL